MNKIRKIKDKKNKTKLICLTAYSKNIASTLDKYCDIILVGDSLGSVLYNFETTKKVSLEMMINHARSVKAGVKKSLLVVDMPFNTYRDPKEALKNARRIIKQTKCDAVKLEGGKKIIPIIKILIKNKISVMGHLGILPQTEKKFVFKGKKLKERNKILEDAQLLEKAGVFSIVLECTEKKLSKDITNNLKIPTIGIGASINCDGQVLVTDDLLGLSDGKFKFVKKFANLTKLIDQAVRKFKFEVQNKRFPKNKHSFQN